LQGTGFAQMERRVAAWAMPHLDRFYLPARMATGQSARCG
jgi:hypothetical protein